MKTTLRCVALAILVAACGGSQRTEERIPYSELPRMRFNQLAVQLNLPVFWVADGDSDGAIDPEEVESLRFYPHSGNWVENGRFTEAFDRAYASILDASFASPPTDPRQRLVAQELASISPALLHTDFTSRPAEHRAFARHMLTVADLIDRLYARQVGMTALADRLTDDPASQSLFRRNWGPRCKGASTEGNPQCSAIEGAPRQLVDVYPAAMQEEEGFCQRIESHERARELLSPFTVVREQEGQLVAVPYHEAYREHMQPIAAELRAAADAIREESEEPLRVYLRAAAQAFEDNQWEPADEAWAAMNARNSHFYVRVGPDEVYWDPCSHKAGFHLTFALIDRGSLQWQERLSPLQTQMEGSLHELVPEYTAREVSFHMPDFIEIIVNAGDDRDAFGATIGQSLPNWGPVREQGRGRTVAMTNLYTDDDSRRIRREQAASLLSAETMELFTGEPEPGLLSTILHEATHNLGPASEHRVEGRSDDEAFGGGMASMLEELKAQSGALFYLSMLREAGIIDAQREREAYLDCVVWAFGHISRGMYTPDRQRKAYSQLAAVQIGFFMDQNVIRWDPNAQAANGRDRGAFTVNFETFPAAARELMTQVIRIKALHDRARAEEVAARYVDGDVVPQAAIVERYLRFPRTSFVYSVDL